MRRGLLEEPDALVDGVEVGDWGFFFFFSVDGNGFLA